MVQVFWSSIEHVEAPGSEIKTQLLLGSLSLYNSSWKSRLMMNIK